MAMNCEEFRAKIDAYIDGGLESAARAEMEKLFDTHVDLQCWVKVKEDWRNRQGLLNSFGYRA